MSIKTLLNQIDEIDKKIDSIRLEQKKEAKELKEMKLELNNVIRQNETKRVDNSVNCAKSTLVGGFSILTLLLILAFNPTFLVGLISGIVCGISTLISGAFSYHFLKKSKKFEKENIELTNKYNNINTFVEDSEEVESLIRERNKLIENLIKTKTANAKDAKKVVKETKTQNKNEELVK